MSIKQKRLHACSIGCIVAAVVALVLLTLICLTVFYAPGAESLAKRLEKSSDLTYTVVTAAEDGNVETESLPSKAKQTFINLQSCYNVFKHDGFVDPEQQEGEDEEEGAEVAMVSYGSRLVEEVEEYRFPCLAAVEYASASLAENEEGYTYGLVLYTDSVKTAVEVFAAYYQQYSNNHSEASQSEYYLLMRGSALIVGNANGFKYMYLNNLL